MRTKRSWWMGVVAVSLLAACNKTVGECWPQAEEDGDFGAGGGLVITGGTGALGNGPARQAQGITYPEAECNIIGQGPCFDKCLADYDAAALRCAQIADDGQRRACQDGAHTAYKNCGQDCAKQQSDCKRCKLDCDAEHDKCHAKCKDANCHARCNDEYAKCLKRCGDCPH